MDRLGNRKRDIMMITKGDEKMSELKNCNDCTFKKCLYKTDEKFEICPVEKKKQELIEKERNVE
jgi:hypothetical protein